MKKLGILAVCAVGIGAFLLLSACFAPFDTASQENQPNVYFSDDGSRVTIAINGNKLPAELAKKAARALTHPLAQSGHDYFEVVFAGAPPVPWSLGESVVVNGVAEDDYDDASKAILFVGRKSDKTLLGVGLLVGVNDTLGNLHIDGDTQTVTFEVAALLAGTSIIPASSSFKSSATDPTGIQSTDSYSVDGFNFPLYMLEPNRKAPKISAEYVISSVASTGLADYLGGIHLKDIGTIYPRVPSYFYNGDAKPIGATFSQDIKVSFANNLVAGPFANVIKFDIETPDITSGGVVSSFYFEIPVCPLATGSKWIIRNGFGSSNNFLLDDGVGGMGGAILLGVGTISSSGTSNGFGVGVGGGLIPGWKDPPPQIPVTSITLNPANILQIYTGAGIDPPTFPATTTLAFDYNAGANTGLGVTWSATPAGIVNVSTSGVVTVVGGVTSGSVTVTVALTSNPSISDTCTIDVDPAPIYVGSILLSNTSPFTLNLGAGGGVPNRTFNVVLTPNDADDLTIDVAFSSGDGGVVSIVPTQSLIDPYLWDVEVTGVTVGSIIITVTAVDRQSTVSEVSNSFNFSVVNF